MSISTLFQNVLLDVLACLMTLLHADSSTVTDVAFRRARREDVPEIVRLLADDHLGTNRESATEPLADVYWDAFAEVDADPRQELIVAELQGVVVGCLQLTILQGLSQMGARYGKIAALRVASQSRCRGIGARMVRHAVETARSRGCRRVQLTSDKVRVDAVRFYERLGFVASHVGLKLAL
jgi:ribosomal protein S18 acetylase RimI-like enzyme